MRLSPLTVDCQVAPVKPRHSCWLLPLWPRAAQGPSGAETQLTLASHSLLILRSPFEFYGLGNRKHVIYNNILVRGRLVAAL